MLLFAACLSLLGYAISLEFTATFTIEGFLEFMKQVKSTKQEELFDKDDFFRIFPAVYLVPNWERDLDSIMKAFLSIEEYNINHHHQLHGNHLSVVIAVDPKESETCFNIIKYNTHLFNQTFVTFILDFTKVTTITSEWKQISTFTQKIKMLNLNVPLGVSFDLKFCLDDHIKSDELTANLVSVIHFSPELLETGNPDKDRVLQNSTNCIVESKNFLNRNLSLSLSLTDEFAFNISNYNGSVSALTTLETLWRNESINIIIPIITTNNLRSAKKNASDTELETWLGSNSSFSADHFGYALYCDREIIDIPTMAAKLVQVTNTILLQNDFETSIYGIEACYNFVDIIYEACRNIGVKINIMFRLHLNFNKTVEENAQMITKLTTLSANRNILFSNVIQTIIINLVKFNTRNNPPESVDILAYENAFLEIKKNLSARFPENSIPKLGLAFNSALCVYLSNTLPTFLQNISVVLFSVYDVAPDFEPSDPVSYANSITDRFETCLNITRSAVAGSAKSQIILYLGLLGCNVEFTDVNRLYTYSNFYQTLSNWISIRTENLILSKALPYGPNTFTVPSLPSSFSTAEICTNMVNSNVLCYCGWWNVSSKENGSERDIRFSDIKTVARTLYENPTFSNFQAAPDLSITDSPALYWGIAVLFWGALVAAVRYIFKPWKKLYQHISDDDIQEFFKGHEKTEDFPAYTAYKYDRDAYEVARSDFKIDYANRLGSGEFGCVYLATIKTDDIVKTVAVKTLQKSCRHGIFDKKQNVALKGLLSEIKILSYVGNHDHIIKLEKACTEKLKSGRVYTFLEFCEMGNLHTHLHVLESEIQVYTKTRDEVLKDLEKWTLEIVDGMEYLAFKKLVHADLAARNILLDSKKTVKIADFGLSHRLYDYSYYVKQQNQEPLPWRWMPPESLRKLIFNEKTDVWSFGVTLWEMYTLGETPYSGINWQPNFLSTLERGLRLSRPSYNVDGIYIIMLKCWNINPARRPAFSALKEMLLKRLQNNNMDISRRVEEVEVEIASDLFSNEELYLDLCLPE